MVKSVSDNSVIVEEILKCTTLSKRFHCFPALLITFLLITVEYLPHSPLSARRLSAVSKLSVLLLLVSVSRQNLRRSSAAFLFTADRTWLKR